MKQRSIGITAIGYGLSLMYGIGLIVYLNAFITSFANPGAFRELPIFASRFKTIEEFRLHAVILWILFFPQLIGLLGVLALKEWGRRLVVGMNIVVAAYVFYRVLFIVRALDALSVASILICVGVIVFFNWSEIKEQFSTGAAAHKTVLLIDDDRGLLKLMKFNLTKKGFNVLTAPTGEEGLQFAKAKKPDLVILDVLMPGIKGREVCKRLKEDKETGHIPVIFLTAKDSEDDINAEVEAGAVSHITKPVDMHVLMEEVRVILKLGK